MVVLSMKSKGVVLTSIIATLAVVALTSFMARQYINTTKKIYPVTPEYETLIPCGNGSNTSRFKECEGLTAAKCEELGGTFNECASPCRHEAPGTMCAQVCVAVCEFK